MQLPKRLEAESSRANRLRAESVKLAMDIGADEAIEHQARAKELEAEADRADNEVLRLQAVAVDRLDDLGALEARLNHPSVTWADCKTEATRLRSEASALVENEQLKEAQPLLELAKVRTSQGYKINRGVKSFFF